MMLRTVILTAFLVACAFAAPALPPPERDTYAINKAIAAAYAAVIAACAVLTYRAVAARD